MIGLNNKNHTTWKYIHIVFCDSNTLWWQKNLKKGFRHCFVIMQDNNNNYVLIDPTCSKLSINLLDNINSPPNISDICKKNKCTSITIPEKCIQEPQKKNAPLAIITCVELVKRVLGIHKRSIITPYKLYRYLKTNYR